MKGMVRARERARVEAGGEGEDEDEDEGEREGPSKSTLYFRALPYQFSHHSNHSMAPR